MRSGIFGFSTNARLKKIAEPLMNRAIQPYEQTGDKQRLFMTFVYQADSWDHPRTLVAKAEAHDQETNLRFVVGNRRFYTTHPFCYGEFGMNGRRLKTLIYPFASAVQNHVQRVVLIRSTEEIVAA